MDGGLALWMLVTLGLGAFVVWGRTAAGRQALRQTVGEPAPVPKQPSRKTNTSAQRSKSVGKASKTASVRPASSKKPNASANAPRSKVAQPNKSGGVKERTRSAKQ